MKIAFKIDQKIISSGSSWISHASHAQITISERFLTDFGFQNRPKICQNWTLDARSWISRANHAQIKRKGPILGSKSVQNQPQMVIPTALFTYTSTTTSRNKTQRTCMASSSRPDTYRCVHIHTYSNLTTRSPQHVMIRRREQQVN